MKEKLQQIKAEALKEFETSGTLRDLNEVKIKYLGKKSLFNEVMKGLKDLSPEERPLIGAAVNSIKEELEAVFARQYHAAEEKEYQERMKAEAIDISMPALSLPRGGYHPLTLITDEILRVFYGMGFSLADGPEIETEYYNFEALNVPADHPARDMQDTLFLYGDTDHPARDVHDPLRINQSYVLRTHTSPVQIRVMEKEKPPLRLVMPGRVYRRDSVTNRHSPIFHQVEGLVVDSSISFSDLKGVLNEFIKAIFGGTRKTRFRPSFFPFTEPSAEVDVECIICSGKGCRVCSHTGWLEIMGAGMVDPNVFKAVGYDAEEVSGFAFGMGVERIAMLKYTIDDIRLFYENDVRFLRQF